MGITPDIFLADEGLRDRLEAAKRTGIGSFTEKEMGAMSTNDLRELAMAEGEEEKRQADLAEKIATEKQDQLDRRFENKTPAQIKEEFERRERLQEITDSPEGQLETAARTAQQKLEDADYVRQQLESQNNRQLDELVAQKVNQATAEQQQSLATQQAFVDSHKDYVTSPENGEAMVKFLRDEAKYMQMTSENLNLAYHVLKQRGALNLLNPDQVAARAKLAEAVQTDEPRRTARSSSVSTIRSDSGFYRTNPKPELSEEEMYSLPIAELKRRAIEATGGEESNLEKHGILSRFGN